MHRLDLSRAVLLPRALVQDATLTSVQDNPVHLQGRFLWSSVKWGQHQQRAFSNKDL